MLIALFRFQLKTVTMHNHELKARGSDNYV
jgi:hypothetical protein